MKTELTYDLRTDLFRRFVNYYNASDYAFGSWEINQNLKPEYSFTLKYDSDRDEYFEGKEQLQFPGHTFRVFLHFTEGRSLSLGAQIGVRGQFPPSESRDWSSLVSFGKDTAASLGQVFLSATSFT